ncbi:LacI family transcriptional regulator [Microbacterium sp. 2C]|uniref:LacI family DNA-binding transcriptional regulator n=1 Tax=Microbacterium paulum TaxID=2707006 RepID=UPI0018C2EB9A|nr:LacI family DNA-binding transcriptional regulator [Microbacterium paulum]MBG0717043.1 LacI family transcriptional regulator [Microbacterium paulum]
MTLSGPPRPATRADVARLAGVSTAVVSYVVNDGPRPVADATRDRVLRAIRSLDYRPNASARALKRGSTKLLGLVLSEIINPFHSECIDALDSAASRRGYSILLASTHGDPERERLMRASLVERGVDGMIFLSLFPDDPADAATRAVDAGIPRLILDRSHPAQGFSTVGADAVEGARLATEHLLSHGHRRIAYIEGPLHPIVRDGRRSGWENALAAAGIRAPAPVVTDWSRAGGAEAVRILMDSPEPPTAVFAGSDLTAVGALQALHERGLRVPEDVAIVSFDGTAESEYAWPPLTTVRQPFGKMAQAAIESFVDGPKTPRAQVFPMQLILRASCGC